MLRWDRARRPLLVVGALLVVAALLPALTAPDAAALRVALSFGWIGLLAMIASLWQPARLRHHTGWVSVIRPPMDDASSFEPYAQAACSCGWQASARGDVDEAFADAHAHARTVVPEVRRPLG